MLPSNPLKKNASSLVFSLNVRELSVPDKRGVSGQTPVKDSDMTRQNKWSTWEDWKRWSINFIGLKIYNNNLKKRSKKELRERENNVTHARRNPKKLVW